MEQEDDEEEEVTKSTTQYIAPRKGCNQCRGTGLITDWVPYGSTQAAMVSLCECIEEQVLDGTTDVEIVLE